MKITNIEAYPVWGGHRNFLFVVVDTDEGIYGVGEAGIVSPPKALLGALEHFKAILVGEGVFSINRGKGENQVGTTAWRIRSAREGIRRDWETRS